MHHLAGGAFLVLLLCLSPRKEQDKENESGSYPGRYWAVVCTNAVSLSQFPLLFAQMRLALSHVIRTIGCDVPSSFIYDDRVHRIDTFHFSSESVTQASPAGRAGIRQRLRGRHTGRADLSGWVAYPTLRRGPPTYRGQETNVPCSARSSDRQCSEHRKETQRTMSPARSLICVDLR